MTTDNAEIIFQVVSSIVLILTLIAIFYQMRTQNKLLKSQLYRDRFDMYWKTLESLSENDYNEFLVFPDDFMARDVFEKKYKGDKLKTLKYLKISRLYEYLAFSFNLKKLKLEDSLGFFWTENWIKDLKKEEEFWDVNDYYKRFYPELSRYINKLQKAQGNNN